MFVDVNFYGMRGAHASTLSHDSGGRIGFAGSPAEFDAGHGPREADN